jgi:mxaJ protein
MLYGNYAAPNPPAEIMGAVERGDIDVALVWGPLAGYFAARSKVPLRLEPVTPWLADNQWPMQFDVSVGVQKDNQKLLKDIDRVLVRRSGDIAKLLAAYRVPVVQQ